MCYAFLILSQKVSKARSNSSCTSCWFSFNSSKLKICINNKFWFRIIVVLLYSNSSEINSLLYCSCRYIIIASWMIPYLNQKPWMVVGLSPFAQHKCLHLCFENLRRNQKRLSSMLCICWKNSRNFDTF